VRGGGDAEVTLFKSDDNETGFVGVQTVNNKFVANYGHTYLGTYKTPEAAAYAYSKVRAAVEAAKAAGEDMEAALRAAKEAAKEVKAAAKAEKEAAKEAANEAAKEAKEAAKAAANSPLKKAQAKKAKLEKELAEIEDKIKQMMSAEEAEDEAEGDI